MNKLTKILIFATVFLIPTYLIRFNLFKIPTNILEILIYLTFVSWIFEKPQIDWKKLYASYKIYIFSIALIFIGLILSTLVNKNYQTGFGIIKGWFFDPILFGFVLFQTIKEKEEVEKILKTLYFSAFAVSLAALEYFFYGYLTYDGRLQAFYNSPNYLAMYLSPAIFIGFYLFKIHNSKLIQNSKFKIQNYIIPLSLFIILFIIYLTYSYAAWVSIIISLSIVRFITKKLSKKFILISLLIIFIAFLTQLGNLKLNNAFSERSSLNSRMMIWKSSTLMLKNNLVFGIGPGNFQNKYLEYQKYFPPYLEWAVPQPHNLYLAFWLQSGIIGFVGFAILILFWFKNILAQIKNNPVLAVFAGIIIYILLHGIFDTTYWKNDLALVFWIALFLTKKQEK
jgi:O-antigen ligase